MKKKRALSESRSEKLNDFGGFIEEFEGTNDRATVILGAARLEALLGDLLRKFLIADPTNVDDLIEPEKPLGSFGSRILILYCVGVIDESQLHVLRQIKKVRNIFAHELHGISFSSPEIMQLCRNLDLWPSDERPASHIYEPRKDFITAVYMQESFLNMAIKNTHQRPPASSD